MSSLTLYSLLHFISHGKHQSKSYVAAFVSVWHLYQIVSYFIPEEPEMPWNCVNNEDNFCYICGKVIFASQKRSITAAVKKAYHLYFGCRARVGPHFVVVTHVQLIIVSVTTKKENLCLLQFQWFDEYQKITAVIAIFVWFPQLQKECQERKRWTVQYPNNPSGKMESIYAGWQLLEYVKGWCRVRDKPKSATCILNNWCSKWCFQWCFSLYLPNTSSYKKSWDFFCLILAG